MNRLIIITTTDISVLSMYTICSGTNLVNYTQNKDSHYEFLEKHADECYYEISKATALVGACKDTPWI